MLELCQPFENVLLKNRKGRIKMKKYNYEAIKIDDLILLLRPGWVAMDEDKLWKWFLEKPELYKNDKGLWISSGKSVILDKSAFYIEPVEDWKTSLRKIG